MFRSPYFELLGIPFENLRQAPLKTELLRQNPLFHKNKKMTWSFLKMEKFNLRI